MSIFDDIITNVSDFASDAVDTVTEFAKGEVKDRFTKGDKTEPQNYVTGNPGPDVSNAPKTAPASNTAFGLTPMQLGLGAAGALLVVLIAKRVI